MEIALEFYGERNIGFHSYFFDFRDNTISLGYYYPMYVDIKNNYVITLGIEGLNVYNIKTNELIQEYRKDGIFEGAENFHYYYFHYNIAIENKRLLFSFQYITNYIQIKRGTKFEYNH
jgi:hypothetical protein